MMIRALAAALVVAAAGAQAAPPMGEWRGSQLADPFGAAAIDSGRYAGVEKRLDGAFARGDRSPEVLLNLAAIRAKEGDRGTAQDLYRLVMQQPDMQMTTLTGTAGAHAIARRGLAGTVTASR